MSTYKGFKELSGKYWYDIQYNARKKGIDFDLDIEYAWDLYIRQNKKCALSGLDIELYRSSKKRNTASLDRVDSSMGYYKDNIQWLHKNVNNLKGTFSNKDTIGICKKIFLEDLKSNRPDWPEYFMNIAYMISVRSKDPATKIGCVLTDESYRILSCGYNGAFQGIDDRQIPLTRPEKYDFFCHAEESALAFANTSLHNGYAFITAMPCKNCCKLLIHHGISKIYYGNTKPHICNESNEEIVRKLCDLKNVKLIEVNNQ